MTILFFDSDARLKQHAKKYLQNESDFEFFNTSLNTISKAKLEPYADTEIISVFIHSEALSNKKLDLLPNLKLIATRSTGFNHIDLDYCKQRGIDVVNVPRYGEVTVAEFTFGLLLDLARKIIRAESDMKHNRVDVSNYMGFDLAGKTIGVIGTGSIGQHVIKLAQGFGMHVIAYDLYPKPEYKKLYAKNGYKNISEYNNHELIKHKRIIFACDELAELLDYPRRPGYWHRGRSNSRPDL